MTRMSHTASSKRGRDPGNRLSRAHGTASRPKLSPPLRPLCRVPKRVRGIRRRSDEPVSASERASLSVFVWYERGHVSRGCTLLCTLAT